MHWKQIAVIVLKALISLSFFGVIWLNKFYQTLVEGTITLENAPGFATITREKDTQIAHIHGEDIHSMVFAQGFAHAQTRLWQMQMTRLAVQGRTAEFFGEKTVGVDKFMRSMGFYQKGVEAASLKSEEELSIAKAYCDGVNDFIKNVDFVTAFWNTASAKLLPPEFYMFGMTGEKLEPYTPEDIYGFSRLISFHLSWNWNQDLARESLRQGHPDLADIVEEVVPFHADFLHAFQTIVDDDDLKEWGQFSEKSLEERYNENIENVKKASPPLDPEIIEW